MKANTQTQTRDERSVPGANGDQASNNSAVHPGDAAAPQGGGGNAGAHEDHVYTVTVILDGEDRVMHFPVHITVREAIRRALPGRDKPDVAEFDMVDGNIGSQALDPEVTLEHAGVQDGHVLSITKKNGGGG